MKSWFCIFTLLLLIPLATFAEDVSPEKMQSVYEEIKTPHKYGVVFKHSDPNKKVDSPTIFREGDSWYIPSPP